MNVRACLSDAEFREITTRSDLRAWGMVLFDWMVIGLTFVVVALWTNPLSILAAVIVLGGRQLALGVLVHEAGHRILFRSNRLNDWVGNWLAGYPVYSDKQGYMKVHLQHHRLAGTADDPDLANYRDYPISRDRLRRKIWRDISGQVGYRRIRSILRALGKLAELDTERRSYLLRSSFCNLLLLGVLTFSGAPWLYLLWVIAFMTSHMLVTRIRQIGEHAAVPDRLSSDARLNTRTVRASWLERFFIAPHCVSWHLEHHLLASVPSYRLQQMHRLLQQKGFYDDVEFSAGYINMLKQVTVDTRMSQPA